MFVTLLFTECEVFAASVCDIDKQLPNSEKTHSVAVDTLHWLCTCLFVNMVIVYVCPSNLKHLTVSITFPLTQSDAGGFFRCKTRRQVGEVSE